MSTPLELLLNGETYGLSDFLCKPFVGFKPTWMILFFASSVRCNLTKCNIKQAAHSLSRSLSFVLTGTLWLHSPALRSMQRCVGTINPEQRKTQPTDRPGAACTRSHAVSTRKGKDPKRARAHQHQRSVELSPCLAARGRWPIQIPLRSLTFPGFCHAHTQATCTTARGSAAHPANWCAHNPQTHPIKTPTRTGQDLRRRGMQRSTEHTHTHRHTDRLAYGRSIHKRLLTLVGFFYTKSTFPYFALSLSLALALLLVTSSRLCCRASKLVLSARSPETYTHTHAEGHKNASKVWLEKSRTRCQQPELCHKIYGRFSLLILGDFFPFSPF